MRTTGSLERIGEIKYEYKIVVEKPEGKKAHFEDLVVDGMVI
jgi:hypothetical protein